MVGSFSLKKALFVAAAICVGLSVFAPAGMAAEEVAVATTGLTIGDGIRVAGLAIGAGLTLMGAALGTARAQAAIGAGGTGALAEKPELFGRIFILVALPETIIVLGFVVGLLLWTSI
jgi:V/A-type H+/Na+-transporting ATPase subunit K